jgi:hypothetical protein
VVGLDDDRGERGRERERHDPEITIEIAMVIANCL